MEDRTGSLPVLESARAAVTLTAHVGRDHETVQAVDLTRAEERMDRRVHSHAPPILQRAICTQA
jgi:hypothetical protein